MSAFNAVASFCLSHIVICFDKVCGITVYQVIGSKSTLDTTVDQTVLPQCPFNGPVAVCAFVPICREVTC